VKKLDLQTLNQFTGTTQYVRIGPRHLLTDGTHYLAEQAECYWLMGEIALHLTELGTQDWFVLITVSVDPNGQAVLTYSDGDGGERARQTIPYTDFPVDSIRLYACWDTEHWVIMLPSEY
jgi:hypothetical protein